MRTQAARRMRRQAAACVRNAIADIIRKAECNIRIKAGIYNSRQSDKKGNLFPFLDEKLREVLRDIPYIRECPYNRELTFIYTRLSRVNSRLTHQTVCIFVSFYHSLIEF